MIKKLPKTELHNLRDDAWPSARRGPHIPATQSSEDVMCTSAPPQHCQCTHLTDKYPPKPTRTIKTSASVLGCLPVVCHRSHSPNQLIVPPRGPAHQDHKTTITDIHKYKAVAHISTTTLNIAPRTTHHQNLSATTVNSTTSAPLNPDPNNHQHTDIYNDDDVEMRAAETTNNQQHGIDDDADIELRAAVIGS